MKLHTDQIDGPWGVFDAFHAAQRAGQITIDIVMHPLLVGSRSRTHGYEIRLYTDDSTSGPGITRRRNMTKDAYAATYDEWGWFIARIFAADPDAIFGPYMGRDDFNAQTSDRYRLEPVYDCGPTSSAPDSSR